MKARLLRAVDFCAGYVARQKVRRELDAMEVAFEGIAEALNGPRFREARRAFYKQVPVGDKGNQQSLDEVCLTDNLLVQPLL